MRENCTRTVFCLPLNCETWERRAFTFVKQSTWAFNTIVGATERSISHSVTNIREPSPEVPPDQAAHSLELSTLTLERATLPFPGALSSGDLLSLEAPSQLRCAGMLVPLLPSPSANSLLNSVVCPNFSKRVGPSSTSASDALQRPVLRVPQEAVGIPLGNLHTWT